jgi:S-adenosylmethionine hydrolase
VHPCQCSPPGAAADFGPSFSLAAVVQYDPDVAHPFISFLTDFGPDGPAPICRGVMLGIAPDAQIVDIAHGVRKYAIRDGAYLLWCALPYMPIGTHVAVVDPGVGTERLAVAIRAGRGDVLVGPDNGLLMPAAERLGGPVEGRRLENRELMLPVTSSTFHGRDIFSPVAAHLASGTPFEAVGPELPIDELVALRFPKPEVDASVLRSSIVYVDSFGNVRLAGEPADLVEAIGDLDEGRPLSVEIEGEGGLPETLEATWELTFGRTAMGATLVYQDSFSQLSLADNQGDVAGRLGLVPDRRVTIRGL